MNIWNLAFSVTNACNLRCKHCYAESGEKFGEEMSLDQICNRLLDEAVLVGTKYITLTGGEPLMREDLFDIIGEIHNRGMCVSLATNGTLINEDIVLSLAKHGVERVQISLEGPSEKQNDTIRGNGVFEKITKHAIPSLKREGVFVAVSLTPTKENWMCIREMAELCVSLKVDTLSVRRFSYRGRAKDNQLITSTENNKTLLNEILKLRKEYSGVINISTGDPLCALVMENKDEYIGKKCLGGCTAGITSLTIDPCGNIKPCTRADYVLGNINISPLHTIWLSDPTLERLRNRERYSGNCGYCKYKMICGGCRASALDDTGSLFGDDPNCWLISETI